MKKNLKKVLAAGLAAGMVMSVSVPAFAAKADGVTVNTNQITFTKEYTVTGSSTITHPNETLTFENQFTYFATIKN